MKWKAEIDLSLQETEDIRRAAKKEGMSEESLLERCLQNAIASAAQKLVEENDGLACPKCGNMMVETLGKRDHYCRECGQKFER